MTSEDSIENIAGANKGRNLVRCYPFAHLVGLYILANWGQVPGLKDQIVTKIIRIYGINSNARNYYWGQRRTHLGATDVDTADPINLAYNNLDDCFLKRLLVRLWIENTRVRPHEIWARYHPNFLSDVINQMMRPENPVSRLIFCEWHEHDGESCSFPDDESEDNESRASSGSSGFLEDSDSPRS